MRAGRWIAPLSGVEVSSPRETTVAEQLTPLDWFCAALASQGIMFCCYLAAFISPNFQKMYADFGGELPALTRLVLMPWVPLFLGLIPAIMIAVALALVGKSSLGVRRGLVAGAAFFSVAASGLCLHAVYLPLFSIAGAIK
jgi:type II secretory pathway component PulF